MSFYFQETVVSGTRTDTHGVMKMIDDITTAMTTMGWSIYDDLRTTHPDKKIVLSSTGEDTTSSGIYLVVSSGTTEALYVQLANSWDNSGHTFDDLYIDDTAGSVLLIADHDGPAALWCSGDLDSVTLMSKARGSYTFVIAGRGANFYGPDLEPWGVYLTYGTAGMAASYASNVRGICGNPPRTFDSGEAEFLSYGLVATNEPRTGLGGDEAVWTACPILFTVDDNSPLAKGAIGIVKNAWSCRGQDTGISSEMVFTVDGSSEEYMVLGGTYGLVLRRA